MANNAPVTMDAIQQLMAAIQQQTTNHEAGNQTLREEIQNVRTDLGARITQIEQRQPPPAPAPAPPPAPATAPLRRLPIRNLFPQDVRARDPPDPVEDPPDAYFGVPNRRREPAFRGFQYRADEPARQGKSDIKLTPPSFSGKVNPEAYMDWERRMEYIFECYDYSEHKKVAIAAAQLTDNALSWWDRELSERRRHHYEQITTWATMKFLMRRRYVAPHFHRDLQKRFRKLSQGSRTVNEYFDEFEQLRNRLELEESEEGLMAQFVDGLNDRIARKVERQPYHELDEVFHIAVQTEQQIKDKVSNPSKSRTNSSWIPSTSRQADKGQSADTDSRSKGKQIEITRTTQPDQGKSSQPFNRTRDITCFKCQGRGHMARECPNQRVMVITASGGYESQDEGDDSQRDDDIEYPEEGELLVTRRMLSAMVDPNETAQRENIFHTRCNINNKVCNLIIDGGSCTNVASRYMVDKLGLVTTKHPKPYRLRWINDQAEVRITEQVEVAFNIGKYHDKVTCDVVPMQAGHILLGRPWQFDREATHDGRTNFYSFIHDKRKHTLAPLSPFQVHEMQVKMAKEAEVSKPNLYFSPSTVFKEFDHKSPVLLTIFKENVLTGLDNSEMPPENIDVRDNVREVFPESIPPGLPPARGIEPQIDLVPGFTPLNRQGGPEMLAPPILTIDRGKAQATKDVLEAISIGQANIFNGLASLYRRFMQDLCNIAAPLADIPAQIDNNASRIQGKLNVSPTFDVSNLSCFGADNPVLWTELFQGGGNDEDMRTDPSDDPLIARSITRTDHSIHQSTHPTDQSVHPIIHLTDHPPIQPIDQSVVHPIIHLTDHPPIQPIDQSTAYPIIRLSVHPIAHPPDHPNVHHPSLHQSIHPSIHPTNHPPIQPSDQSAAHPIIRLSDHPNIQPSAQPIILPSDHPIIQPSDHPITQPSDHPSIHHPSIHQSNHPIILHPSFHPTDRTSMYLTDEPSVYPTDRPPSHSLTRAAQPNGVISAKFELPHIHPEKEAFLFCIIPT